MYPTEEFAVLPADGFPVVDVRDVHARANHRGQVGAERLKRGLDVLNRLHRLGVRIAEADHRTARVGRRGPGNVDG